MYIRGGTYQITEQIHPQNSGQKNKWITYTGYPGEKVIIDANEVYVRPPIGQPPFPRD